QKSGKIGRIEITKKKGKGTTSGEVVVPSSLDQVKTSILAATIETVEKVGPFEAKVKVLKIGDTRKEKRENITDRAKELLKTMQKFEGVESNEIANTIKTEIRTEKIINLNGLQAGPEVESNPEIIVVEGRADVLRLLSYGINNAVAMNGGNIDPAIIGLCKIKTVTVLIDGDRGGELNVKKLASLTKVDFVAKAPDGKEVEELAQKEILQALKRKVPYSEAFNGKNETTRFEETPQRFDRPRFNDGFRPRTERSGFGGRAENSGFSPRPQRDRPFGERNFGRSGPRGFERRGFTPRPENGGLGERTGFGGYNRFHQGGFSNNYPSSGMNTQVTQREEPIPEELKILQKDFDKLKGKSKARLLDDKKKKIKEMEVKDLLEELQKSKKKVSTIIFDGIITNRLVEAAEAKGVTNIIGVKKGNTNSEKVKLYTM
ncbi:MAG: DNA primase DnaG, partial [Candidatus Diapherotrites archaeon]|nr:DNA primase DnaG [Candidatus Diapherotrites archaeon]